MTENIHSKAGKASAKARMERNPNWMLDLREKRIEAFKRNRIYADNYLKIKEIIAKESKDRVIVEAIRNLIK